MQPFLIVICFSARTHGLSSQRERKISLPMLLAASTSFMEKVWALRTMDWKRLQPRSLLAKRYTVLSALCTSFVATLSPRTNTSAHRGLSRVRQDTCHLIMRQTKKRTYPPPYVGVVEREWYRVCHMMNLEPLGRKILAIFLATAYLGEKMSTIVKLMSAAHPQCYLARMLWENKISKCIQYHRKGGVLNACRLNICTTYFWVQLSVISGLAEWNLSLAWKHSDTLQRRRPQW